MNLRVFISGPYSTGDQVENMRAALDAADQCLQAGLFPFVPHLSGFWHFVHPHEYETWLAYDLVWLEQCDILWRLPGESKGADREVAWATQNGTPVCERFEDVIGVASYYYNFWYKPS